MYITREDNVILVQRPNYSHVTQFQDGTRFTVATTEASGDCQVSETVIECSGFASVHYTASTKQCCLQFPDDSCVTCINNGMYEVKKQGDYELHIEGTGEAQYKIPNATYTLDHTKWNNVLFCKDSKENVFSMNGTGIVSAESVNPVVHKSFLPRYFVLNADKTAYELHRSTTVKEFVSSAKSCLSKVVVKGTVPSQPDISTTTVIEPIHHPRVTPVVVALKEDSIVPHNLRCGDLRVPSPTDPSKPKPKFGSLVGKGLTIGHAQKPLPPPGCSGTPLALKYRQFLHLQPLTDSRREEICNFLASFIHQSSEHMKKCDAMQPVEMRDDSEIKFSNSLQLRFYQPNDISSLFKNGLEKKLKKPTIPLPPSMSQEGMAFIEQSKSELEEAEDIRAALCNKIIPPFFKSEQGKKYELVESQNIEHLSTKLVQVPDITKSQTTLQSSSLSLTLDDSEFVIQDVCACTSLANKELSSLISPDLTQQESPATQGRPTNPIPWGTHLASSSLANPSPMTSSKATSCEEKEHPGPKSDTLEQLLPSGTVHVPPTSLAGGQPWKQENVKV